MYHLLWYAVHNKIPAELSSKLMHFIEFFYLLNSMNVAWEINNMAGTDGVNVCNHGNHAISQTASFIGTTNTCRNNLLNFHVVETWL